MQKLSDYLIVLMGVSGCGKSTIANELAVSKGWKMIEGDDFHPENNRKKMSMGSPLNNNDRMPWLKAIADQINQYTDEPLVLACSALNQNVRDVLTMKVQRKCLWFFLDAHLGELELRLTKRKGHFMPASLLQSQLDALDPPKDAIKVDASLSIQKVCDQVTTLLNERIK